jgi:lipoprotein NlpD
LFSIALDNGLDYRELAEWNGITDLNVIQVGQELRLRSPEPMVQVQPASGGGAPEARPLGAEPVPPRAGGAPIPPRAGGAKAIAGPKVLKLPYSEENLALLLRNDARPAATQGAPEPKLEPKPELKPPQASVPQPAPQAPGDEEDRVDWGWPAGGRVLAGFSEASNKGLDISGKIGDPVFASAAGRVVYSGQGLRGYGKLVIIKHNPTYLSAYAHNHNLLVKEGQNVVKGQKIAEMGNTDSQQAKLHFEIRRLGKPIDPAKLLPERGL